MTAQTAADFDRLISREGTWSSKWEKYRSTDVLPFWVADMEFAMPDFIKASLTERLDREILGYTRTPPPLVEKFRSWLAQCYGWEVPESWLVWIPGVVTGFNLAARAVATPGGSVVIPVPVYYPFLHTPDNAEQEAILVPLVREESGGRRWVMDFDALTAATQPHSRLFMLSNPQNPTGRAYQRSELEALAQFCIERDLILCSDEIHCSLILEPAVSHIPIASLSPEIADRTISLFAPTKTYNIPGLGCAVAVIANPQLRRAFRRAQAGLVPGIGPLAYAAAEAAYGDTGPWLPALLDYLRGNHRRLQSVARERMTPVEATYLAWLDVRDMGLDDPASYFESYGLGLSDGAAFGGPGFVRFNFGCPRPLLERGLARLERALRGG
jgi:cystathionine beta-lyase